MKKKKTRNDKTLNIGEELVRIARKKNNSPESALNLFIDYALRAFDVSKIEASESYEEWVKAVLAEDGDYKDLCLEWMKKVHESLVKGKAYDFFGGVYEEMFQSKGKASSTGQFFTPMGVCELMARLTPPNDDGGLIRLSDPCCGSGRLLLAHIAENIKNRGRMIAHAEDIDIVSCGMCALNLMAHECFGAVVCHDVLMYDVPHTVFIVNECKTPDYNPVMSIRTLKGETAERWWKAGGYNRLEEYFKKQDNEKDKDKDKDPVH